MEKDDFLPLEGEKNSHVILTEGDFLLCYPKDAHRTAVQVEKPVKIKKAILRLKFRNNQNMKEMQNETIYLY